VVIDLVLGLAGHFGGVHAVAQGLFDGGASAGGVTCCGPACCNHRSVSIYCLFVAKGERQGANRRNVLRTEDMTTMQGFSSGRFGFRTRSAFTGGRRIGFEGIMGSL
jgi:hypothetical protein